MTDAPRDPIVEAVRADLLRRSQVGIAKYGVTLARKDLSLRDWLQHAYEETLDQANYLKRAIREFGSAGACPDCGSTNTRRVNGGAVCDACGFDATPPDEEGF